MDDRLSPVLSVRSVTMAFGGVVAVSNASFEVFPGETVAILGQNGSGKTTLINVISGVLKPTSGEVWLLGKRVNGLRLEAVARGGLARTFQNLRLFESRTALDNAMLGALRGTASPVPDPLSRRTRRALVAAGQAIREMGIEARAGDRVSDLSHGDRRRVEIARAFSADPTLLILDEPTAGLGLSEADYLRQALRRVGKGGRAALLIEHDLAFAASVASRVIVMHAGAIIASGGFDEVLAMEIVRNNYFSGSVPPSAN
jgi:ABC-type branched-subunit amino acid transport system ATPase component